ncbi:MAG: hypothetical protein AAF485_11750, partial [Chloroflexota bacterium]
DLLNEHLDLVWIYTKSTNSDTPPAPLIAPPVEELQALHQMALIGAIRRIRTKAEDLQQMDERYLPFANKLTELAETFDDEGLIDFIETYYDQGKQVTAPQ